MDRSCLSQLNMLRCPAVKDAAFAMCLPLSQLGTTHFPSHAKAQGRPREGQVQFTQLIAKQISMIKPNKANKICQAGELPKLVSFHFTDFLEGPQAQHLL